MGEMKGWCWALGMKIVVILAVFATEPSRALLSSRPICATDSVANFYPSNSDVGLESFRSIAISPICATDSIANFCPSNSDVGLDYFRSIAITEDKKKTIDQSVLLCCKVYISESRNLAALDKIEQAARLNPETVIVSKFEDKVYNRVRYTLVSYVQNITGSPIYSPLQQTVLAMVEAAFGAINLEQHTGAYPRLGVVDDILIHPLAQASMNEAVWLAKAMAADIGSQFQVPVYLYDEAHPQRKDSSTIRHNLGYFKLNAEKTKPNMTEYVPNEGNAEDYSPERGITTIGASPWVDLYNIPILSKNKSVVKNLAKAVREEEFNQTGHHTVKTLGQVHGDDSEILCMLYEPKKIGTDWVQDWVEKLAAKEGLALKKGYFTDFSEERTIETYNNFKPHEGDQSNTIIEQLVISTKFQFASGDVRIKTLDHRIGRINLVLELPKPKKEIRLTIMIPQWTRQEHFFL